MQLTRIQNTTYKDPLWCWEWLHQNSWSFLSSNVMLSILLTLKYSSVNPLFTGTILSSGPVASLTAASKWIVMWCLPYRTGLGDTGHTRTTMKIGYEYGDCSCSHQDLVTTSSIKFSSICVDYYVPLLNVHSFALLCVLWGFFVVVLCYSFICINQGCLWQWGDRVILPVN